MGGEIWVPLLAVLVGSGGVGWFLAFEQRRKLRADTGRANVDALIVFRGQLNEVSAENVKLRQEQDAMRTEFRQFRASVEAQLLSRDRHIEDLTAHVARLEVELVRLGGVVPPRPWPAAP